MAFIQQIQGFVSRVLPGPAGDTNAVNVRSTRYGDLSAQLLHAKKHGLAEEGTYFVSTNPTPGTGVAGPVNASFSATGPFFAFVNNNPAGGARASLDYLKIIPTVAPASATGAHLVVVRDQISRALTTDNTVVATPVNVNGDSANKAASIFKYTVTTINVAAAATPTAAIVARASVSGIPVIGDELVFDFGATDTGAYPGLTAGQVTAGGRKVSVLPPVICAPQQLLFFYLWFPGNAATGVSYEFELGHWER